MKKMLLDPGTCPSWLSSTSFEIPVNIYEESMPDMLCMRYGRLMNELQTVHQNPNLLDDSRFIQNIQNSLPPVQLLS
jgi:hypothetical protein